VTSEFRKLVEVEVLGFIESLGDKGYFLRNENDENSKVPYSALYVLLKEYLSKGEVNVE
jgi:hypothetical protein